MHVESVTVTVAFSNGDEVSMTHAKPEPAGDNPAFLREQVEYGGLSVLDRIYASIRGAYGIQVLRPLHQRAQRSDAKPVADAPASQRLPKPNTE